MTIIQQCETCSKVGNNNKNIYCNNCIKSDDYFDVYKYEGNNNNSNNNRFGEGRLIGRIKAYTWHDAIEYIKNNLFSSDQRKNLNTNCEKDFAYIEKKEEEKIPSTITTSENGNKPEKAKLLGYKIYLNNEGGAKHSESSLKGKEFWDLTTIAATTTSGITDANNNNNNSTTVSNTSNKEEYNTKQQQ
jgi:hypothetical protein